MKKITVLLLFMLALISSGIANAEQANSSSNSPLVLAQDPSGPDTINLHQWYKDTGTVFSRPLHWDASDWHKVFLYTGLTYLIYHEDSHIQNWVQERRNSNTNHIAQIGDNFPTIGAAYLTGTYFFGNEHQRETAVNGLESTGIALLITQTLKSSCQRHRPNANDGPSQWDGPGLSTKNQSFSSGHTAAAFALATVIADEYHNKKVVPPLMYGLATLTAYSRLNDNMHWGSDVFVGGLIGYYTAKTVMRLNTSRSYQLQPSVASGKTLVIVSKKF